MAVVKKTISIPEELYQQAISEGRKFSEVVREAIEEYLKDRKRRKALKLWGKLKNWEVGDGREFVGSMREEQIEAQEEREKWLNT